MPGTKRPSEGNQKLFFCELICKFEEAIREMRYCPECGGEMQYIAMTKRYVCKSCGLSVTHQEMIELRQQMNPKSDSDTQKRKKAQKEYLKWWLGKKE